MNCPTCKNLIAPNAYNCPKCGHKFRSTPVNIFFKIVFILVGISLLIPICFCGTFIATIPTEAELEKEREYRKQIEINANQRVANYKESQNANKSKSK